MKERIYQILDETFAPERLEVVNESSHHAGHRGDDGSGESHFRVYIRAPALASLSRLARHRAIYEALGEKIMQKIHALAIDAG